VVAGILAALILQAWWGGRAERGRERIYLTQLSADLSETERTLVSADAWLRPVLNANSQLLRAFHMDHAPTDSIGPWIITSLQFREYRPVLGTVEALVATGDLSLIRNADLRSEITKYLDESRELVLVEHNFSEEWRRGWALLHARIDLDEVLSQSFPEKSDSMARADPTHTLPLRPSRHPFPFDPKALLADRDSYEALQAFNTGLRGMAWARDQMLIGERSLNSRITADMRR
jgi:hypothetical protein